MARQGTDELLEDFRLASVGIRRGDPEASSASGRWARRVLEARRDANAAERCPTAVVRRVEGWFAARPRGVASRLLELVVDSGARARPAVRGPTRATRMLRCAGDGCTVDAEIVSTPRGRIVRLAVAPAVPGTVADVRVRPGRATRRVRIDAAGVGELRIPAHARTMSAVFRVGGVVSFRVADLPLA